MNFEGIGVPIAKVINTKSKKERVLYVSDEDDDSNFESYICKQNEIIQQTPNEQAERQVSLVLFRTIRATNKH